MGSPENAKFESRDFKAKFTAVPNLLGDKIQKSQSTVLCIRPFSTHAQRQRATIAKHESMLTFLRRRIVLKLPNFSNIWHHPLGAVREMAYYDQIFC